MSFPVHVAEAIDDLLGKTAVPRRGEYARGKVVCQGAAFHSPTPLTLLGCWITPKPMEGLKDEKRLIVPLCPTCAANLRCLQDLLLGSEGELPWAVRREFGNQIRSIALRGWERYMKEVGGA